MRVRSGCLFSRAEAFCSPGRCGFKARRRSQKARKTQVGQTHLSLRRHLAPRRALNPGTGAFFETPTCAVCRAIFRGRTMFCATGQLTLPRDTAILPTSNLCPSCRPPCDTFFPVFPGTQFSPKIEEMGPCAGQGGDPPPPARRGCAVHTDAASRQGDALRRARNSVLIGRGRLRWSI